MGRPPILLLFNGFLSILVLLLSFLCANAQPYVDIFDAQYKYFPPADYHDLNAQLEVREMKGKLFVPVPLESGDVIIGGASFNRQSLHFLAEDSSQIQPLSSATLQLGINKQWNNKWKTLFLALPKLSSDFEDINQRHWQMGGIVLASYKYSEDVTFKGGLYYNREFFGNFFMPLGGINWDVTERWNIFGVLPGSMTIEYKLKDWLYTGLGYQAITGSFRLSRGNHQLYVREGHTFWSHNQLWAFLDVSPVKNVVLYAEAGHTLWRSFDLYNEQDQLLKTIPWYRSFKDGAFFTIGAAYRIRLKDREGKEND